MVYRGAVSFTLTARAEGELLENNQVVLMMRLSLCMIWISVFQHILTTNPHVPLHVEFKEVEEEVMKENEENLLTVNQRMVKWKMFKQKEKDKTKNFGVSGRKNKKW